MQVFDASSMLYAWDNYPIRQFPGLWEWMATHIVAESLVIPNVAYEEVEHKYSECADWLKDKEIKRLGITNAIAQDAMRIKGLLGIIGDNYHPKGVDENDIFIISTALNCRSELISNEGRQQRPDLLAKSKIPVVCAMPEVSVSCINFLEYIKRSDEIFR